MNHFYYFPLLFEPPPAALLVLPAITTSNDVCLANLTNGFYPEGNYSVAAAGVVDAADVDAY